MNEFSKKRNFLFLSLLVLAYGSFISIFSTADFPTSMKGGLMPYLSDKPIGEDGFYMLEVAWNIANNEGITYSGIPTTGIQPLVTLIYSGIAWINIHFLGENKWLFLRQILFLGTINHIYNSYLMGTLCSLISPIKNKEKLFQIGSTLTLFSFGIFRLSTYGLETGLYITGLLSFTLFLLFNLRIKNILTINQVLFLGFLSGFLVLIRIDFLIIIIITFLILFIKKRLSIKIALQVFFISISISSPWFLYVKRTTDKYIPSSGGAQSGFININDWASRFYIFFKDIISHTSIFLINGRDFLFLGSLLIVTIFVINILINKTIYKDLKILISNDIFKAVSFSILLLSIIYLLTFTASHFYYRYICPIILIIIPVISISLINLFNDKKFLNFLCIFFFTFQALGSLHSGNIGNSHAITSGYIQKNFQSKGELIGAFQSGVIGYFNDNVYNLDGKLDHNALVALKRHKDKNDSYKFFNYIEEKQIKIIVDGKSYFNSFLSELISEDQKKWTTCKKEINNGETICIKKIES